MKWDRSRFVLGFEVKVEVRSLYFWVTQSDSGLNLLAADGYFVLFRTENSMDYNFITIGKYYFYFYIMAILRIKKMYLQVDVPKRYMRYSLLLSCFNVKVTVLTEVPWRLVSKNVLVICIIYLFTLRVIFQFCVHFSWNISVLRAFYVYYISFTWNISILRAFYVEHFNFA